jgi:hypothetical protein
MDMHYAFLHTKSGKSISSLHRYVPIIKVFESVQQTYKEHVLRSKPYMVITKELNNGVVLGKPFFGTIYHPTKAHEQSKRTQSTQNQRKKEVAHHKR